MIDKKLKDWNQAEVLEKIGKLNIQQDKKTHKITTTYDGVVTSEYKPTKIYQMVDFPKVAASFIDKVTPHMDVDKYELKINRGIQEIRLFGKEFIFCGETYRKQAVMLSSSDGTRTFSFMAGLYRQVCTNGMMTKVNGTAFRVKHTVKNQDVVKVANLDFGDLQTALDGLMSRVEVLKDKNLRLQEILNVIRDKESGKGDQKALAFIAKLYTSKTDKMDYQALPLTYKKHIRKDEKGVVTVSPEILKMKALNLEIPAYQGFQCYTEIIRAWDGAVIESRTQEFLSLAN